MSRRWSNAPRQETEWWRIPAGGGGGGRGGGGALAFMGTEFPVDKRTGVLETDGGGGYGTT